MKKIGILLITLILINLAFITGCTEQREKNNENDTEPNTNQKYNEFVNWSLSASLWLGAELKLIESYWENESWDDCLSAISQAKSDVGTYTNQALFFDLQGPLDSARNEYIKWLNAYKQIYEEWETAIQYFKVGDNVTGNAYAQEGQNLLENSKTYADNVGRYITEWRDKE